MNAGLPGAGIGGLFYLASTILLPIRSAWRRLRGRPDGVSVRQHLHHLGMVLGIVAGLWCAGWLLAFVAPIDLLTAGPPGAAHGPARIGRTVIPAATFAIGVATLLLILGAVELARLVERRANVRRDPV